MELVLEKMVQIGAAVDKMTSIAVYDKIEYIQVLDGVKITGTISIEADVFIGDGKQHLSFPIDVDLFAPGVVIITNRNFAMKISRCEHQIKEDQIYFQVFLNITGLDLDIPTAYYPDEPVIIDQELPGEKIIANLRAEQQAKEALKHVVLEEAAIPQVDRGIVLAMESDAVETLADIPEESLMEQESPSEDNVTCFTEEKEIESPEDNSSAAEVLKNIDVPMIEEKVLVEEKKEEYKVPDQKSNFWSRFASKKEAMWKFHAVSVGDSYQAIASRYHIDEEKLVQLNENRQLTVGVLIKLP